jgi:sugar/nucleoside kinase (ribokinase family)
MQRALRSRFFPLVSSTPPDLEEDISMARKTIFVSDLTGKTIDEKDAATVTIRYADARRGQVVLDVNASEVADLAAKGTKQARRGRKPKNQS